MTVLNIKIIKSGDGSHTLFDEELNETYHSTHGAVTESLHVFIRNGFNVLARKKNSLKIFEVGFGTGLNALLTLKQARLMQQKVTYHSLEPFPLPKEIYTQLNYPDFVDGTTREDLNTLHEAKWDLSGYKEEYFELQKKRVRFEDYEPEGAFDLIYYDAFAPSKQKEVWCDTNIRKAFKMLDPQGILVTYCASGQFRRDMKAAGFEVESLPGPPGKKEMTKGVKVS